MEATVQWVLNRAADLIEERGWCQGEGESATGALCLYSAINQAEPGIFLRALADREVRRRVRKRVDIPTGPIKWNDTPGRTVDEVLNLLRGL